MLYVTLVSACKTMQNEGNPPLTYTKFWYTLLETLAKKPSYRCAARVSPCSPFLMSERVRLLLECIGS